MITYDSSKWRTLFRIEGSVFPKAIKYATVSAVLAGVLKWLDGDGEISNAKILENSSGFTLFAGTLSFVLVFRTSQCYSRFWHCATSVSTMRAQMAEAASSLVTFSIMSKHPPEDVKVFRHKIVRLFSLLHAMCLATFCASDEREKMFPIIDMESFEPSHLKVLSVSRGKERVDIVYSWINSLIIKSLDNGLLNVPPPILSRVFQEMEKAMVEFHQVMQVMTIPFPFPYAQMAVVLLCTMVLVTPIAMCYWTDHPVGAAILTFAVITCFSSLELIADELDNPFGDDKNDLPCEIFQKEMNESLFLLLTPEADYVPELRQGAVSSLEVSLKREDSMVSISLEECDKPESNWTGNAAKPTSVAARRRQAGPKAEEANTAVPNGGSADAADAVEGGAGAALTAAGASEPDTDAVRRDLTI